MAFAEVVAKIVEEKVKSSVDKIKDTANTISEVGIKEYAKNEIEMIEKSGDAVLAKLDLIRNLSPDQLEDQLSNTLNKAKEILNAKDSEHTSVSEETGEGDRSELSEEEINAKQVEAIKSAIERIRNGESLTTEELGNLGEMMMDQYYISQGYTPLNKHRVTSLDDKKGGFRTGIDGVYEKTNPDGSKTYVIADAKYNKSQLSETVNDGKQMSDQWIDNRLDNAVGKETADEIRDAAEDDPTSVKHEVYHIDPTVDENGNTHTDIQAVDSMGNKIGEKIIVEYFDEAGNKVDPPEINKDKEAE